MCQKCCQMLPNQRCSQLTFVYKKPFYPSFRMYFNLLTLVVSTTLFMKRAPVFLYRNLCIRCFQLKQNGVATWNVQMKNLSNVQELDKKHFTTERRQSKAFRYVLTISVHNHAQRNNQRSSRTKYFGSFFTILPFQYNVFSSTFWLLNTYVKAPSHQL